MPQHADQGLLSLLGVYQVLVLGDCLKALGESFLSILDGHVGGELGEVTGVEVDHLLILGFILGVSADP